MPIGERLCYCHFAQKKRAEFLEKSLLKKYSYFCYNTIIKRKRYSSGGYRQNYPECQKSQNLLDK